MSMDENKGNGNGGGGYKGLLILILGPSGSGKGTVIDALKKRFPGFVYPLSCTTRPIRPGEKEGDVYKFLTKQEFEDAMARGEFLECALVHGINYYGTLKNSIISSLDAGKVSVREVDLQGYQSISSIIPKQNLLTIFLKVKSKEDLIARILHRASMSEDEIKHRMESADKEMKAENLFDYRVMSLTGQAEKCVEEIAAIIRNETQKRGIQIDIP